MLLEPQFGVWGGGKRLQQESGFVIKYLKTFSSCFKQPLFLPFGETITMKQSVAGLAWNCSAQLSDLI